MNKEPSFIEFIGHICKRPSMYTLGGTYNETVAFVQGYSSGIKTPISDKTFDRFVCLKNSFPTNYVWSYVIKECSKDDNEAISLMENTILEFISLKKTMTEEELLQVAIENNKSEEGEAEKVFREFDRALFQGNKEIIKSLIIENNEAKVLWSGSYPKDVGIKLNEISSNQPIKNIPLSEDGSKVKIIAQGWSFAIEMQLINGNWKINADNIIELRKRNKST